MNLPVSPEIEARAVGSARERKPLLSAGELRPVIAAALVIVAVSCIPYIVGYLATPPGRVFGGFVLEETDANAYLAKIQQGYQGEWTYALTYTPEEHPRIVLYLFFLTLGHIAAWLNVSIMLVYHATRIVCAFCLLVSLYLFFCLFFDTRRARWVAFLLAAIGSGIGWLTSGLAGTLSPGGSAPLDFWLKEAYVFFVLFLHPHQSLSLALVLGLLGGMVLYFRDDITWSAWILSAVCGLLLTIVDPYGLALATMILALYWTLTCVLRRALLWRQALVLTSLAVLCAPVISYDMLQFRSHPVWQSFLAQDEGIVVPLYYFVPGYGLILLLALVGLWNWLKERTERQLLLVAWPIVSFSAVYFPLPAPYRMILGTIIPLSGLASDGLQTVMLAIGRSFVGKWLMQHGYGYRRLEGTITLSVVALVSLSNLFLVASSSLSAAIGPPNITRPAAVEDAIAWLGKNTAPDAIILSSYPTGNLIPARTGRRVVLGELVETAFRKQKMIEVSRFYSKETKDHERRNLLRRYRVAYVFHGPAEHKLGDFNPETAPYLRPVFHADQVTVFQAVDLDRVGVTSSAGGTSDH